MACSSERSNRNLSCTLWMLSRPPAVLMPGISASTINANKLSKRLLLRRSIYIHIYIYIYRLVHYYSDEKKKRNNFITTASCKQKKKNKFHVHKKLTNNFLGIFQTHLQRLPWLQPFVL